MSRIQLLLIVSLFLNLGCSTKKETPSINNQVNPIEKPSEPTTAPPILDGIESNQIIGTWYVYSKMLRQTNGKNYDYYSVIYHDGNKYYERMYPIKLNKNGQMIDNKSIPTKEKDIELRKVGDKYFSSLNDKDFLVIKEGSLSYWDDQGIIPDYVCAKVEIKK